jgi:predicted phage terminase large subunit-like protein
MKSVSKTAVRAELARRHFGEFVRFVQPRLAHSPFHRTYYDTLDRFARGELRKLAVTIPPQHGKSTGSSVLLPAWLLGRDPDLRIALASYNLHLASRFNRQVQRLIDSKSYRQVFPDTRLRSSLREDRAALRTADEFDLVGRAGGLLSVGREGTLTGNPVDLMIIDDLYKDALEGNSPVVRDNAWEWYVSVVRTRLHNDSRELVVMTRWHDDDLIGRLERREPFVEVAPPDEAAPPDARAWHRLHFEAIRTGKPSPLDPRQTGEALWPERQSIDLLREKRKLDPPTFECMYQGNPSCREGLLYAGPFATYRDLPADTVKKGNYTDTADTGEDYLCSICYEVGRDGLIYLTDLVYTPSPMEITEEAVAAMLNRNATRIARIESNNGGRGFARNVAKECRLTKVEGFTQRGNKESRILTGAATVMKQVVMPADWPVRWPEFHAHVSGYRRAFRANRFHDAADVLTGLIETEIVDRTDKSLKRITFSK